jgi:transcriptional regulator GlxA family with amidase domain/YHS domain-containing protein
VAETSGVLKVSGGLSVVPDYTFANAPQPNVIVVPALGDDPTPAMLQWLQRASKYTELTMSVCNGALVLAQAGLLDGKEAVAHHGSLTLFAADYPNIKVKRGARFVDAGAISTAGGLTSGIDLALHVVERYFGRDVAQTTATSLEYQGLGWKNPQANVQFATRPRITGEPPRCPVCEAELLRQKATYRMEVYKGKTYYFCSQDCKDRFDKTPDRFIEL